MDSLEETPRHKNHTCPHCGGSVTRSPRHWHQRWIHVVRPVKHYTCANPGCGWEGTLFSRQLSRRRRRRVRQVLYGIFVGMLFLLAFAVAGFLVARMLGFVLR